MASTRPNILWVCTDQQRFDAVGALGNQHVRTPALDRLAGDGVAFSRAYCQNPVCTPSRASFMAGRYPSALGLHVNGNERLPESARPLLASRILADAGYDCGLVGKLHLAGCAERPEPRCDDGFRSFRWSHSPRNLWAPEVHDYTRWLQELGHDPAEVLHLRDKRKDRALVPSPEQDNVPPALHHLTWARQRALEFLDEATEPWLLCLNTFEPHPPFNPPWEYYRRHDPHALPGPWIEDEDFDRQLRLERMGVDFQTSAVRRPDGDRRELQAAYYAMVEFVDEVVGSLLERLVERGQRDRTVVLFMSDHGEMLGDHGLVQKGCRFYEGLVRVPLIWSGPGIARSGRPSQALVELTDVAPTLYDLAGLPTPGCVQGRSLAPLLRGEVDPDFHRAHVRCEYFDSLGTPNRPRATMYRDDRWKLSLYHSAGTGELYDLERDPHEHHDLWDDPACSGLRGRLIAASFDATISALDQGARQVMDY